ncbi:MAG: xanthan lyase [Candidatus Cryptobacteroides sp.]
MMKQYKKSYLVLRAAILLAAMFPPAVHAQSRIVTDFQPVCDSLTIIMQERTGVLSELKLKSVMKRGNFLDFYFTESLGDLPWHDYDPQSFRSTLRKLFPEKYKNCKVGEIYSKMIPLAHLTTPTLGFDGTPSQTRQRTKNPDGGSPVREIGRMEAGKGLEGRVITLWQSHGRYYEEKLGRWEWQRPCLFQTVEDMFTQGFVLPFLVPMLENAGAYVMLPRERDFRKEEIIADNDSTWIDAGLSGEEYGYGTDFPARTAGRYEESGEWEDAGTGFGDIRPVYSGMDNPFTLGTARSAECLPADSRREAATAVWSPDVKVEGEYAVYVSYKTLPQSTSCAHYKVRHAGGEQDFVVNQQIGGGMWIYLGTFPFSKDKGCCITLEARTPKGYRHDLGSVVTADGVKFGGGMGNIERNGEVSGMPRNSEGARYWLQWSGADSTVFSPNEGKDDYKDDFMSRGDWSSWISEGSRVYPPKAFKADQGGMSSRGGKAESAGKAETAGKAERQPGKGIPVDLSLGFHSDAGVTPNDSIIGTLAIYTYKSEGRTELPSKESRMTSRELADMVQSQIVNDVRENLNPDWSRRQIWDRGYRESRTPSAPSMLLELLSHQNFADMKYGLDPTFRFVAGRAVYKGMLKYLSNRFGCPYVVQPLPVQSMSAVFSEDSRQKVTISWKETDDMIEPTAKADGFILYTRIDSGAFDLGRVVRTGKAEGGRFSTEVEIEPGHIYSWKIVAFNDGGRSFPSEILSAGIPLERKEGGDILIVNNFDRVSCPAYIDTPSFAGFDERTDRGVPYIRDITYTGDMFQFRRNMEWTDDDNPGFGASYTDYAGNALAGNTFDYPSIHGKGFLKAGRAFCSCSADAFCSVNGISDGASCVDLICGKQVTTASVTSDGKFTVFTSGMQDALRKFTSRGGNVMASGSNIGTDIWDRIYPVRKDSIFTESSIRFAKDVLGFRWMTNHASRSATVKIVAKDAKCPGRTMCYSNTPNPDIYCVESPDGIVPSDDRGRTFARYADTGVSAGVSFEGDGYRTVCYGFPLECLIDEKDLYDTISATLEFFDL